MPLVSINTATFNGIDLASVSGLTILATNPYEPAMRRLMLDDLARSDLAKVSSAFYTKKSIVVQVGITRATRDLVEQSVDSLMTILQATEKYLVIKQSGSTRKYTCTYQSTNMKIDGGSYVEMQLVFETSDHFGYDINPTLLLQVTGFTSGQSTNAITVGGSAPWQVPVITITMSSVAGSGTRAIIVGNGATGQAVTISRSWTAGDVIVINASTQSIKVNGAEVTSSGAIPEFAPGVNYLTYTDNFTARTFSLTAVYNKRYV